MECDAILAVLIAHPVSDIDVDVQFWHIDGKYHLPGEGA
jgi:hypothetical protein